MERLKKSNRVSWAPSVELSQISLFLPEDYPSKVRLSAQDQVHTKAPWTLDSNDVDSDCRRSRLEGSHCVDPLKEKISHIPQIKWKCPPKFVLKNKWRVAAAEDSKEAEAQKRREMRVLESVYTCHSAIPPSPSASLDVEECDHDGNYIPLIPVFPVEEDEDEDDAADMQSDIAKPPNTPLHLQDQGMFISGNPNAPECNTSSLKPSANEKPALEMLSGVQADVAAAAAAALIAITKSNEQGNLIDTDLLIKILSNPEVMEKMINEQKAPADNESASISLSKPVLPLVPLPVSQPNVVRKSINDHGGLISGLEPVFSWPSPIPDIGVLAQNLQPVSNVMMQPSLPMEPVSPDSVSVSSSSAMTPKRMINEYVAPDSVGSEPMSRPIPLTPVFSWSSPKPYIGVLQPNLQPLPHAVTQPDLPMEPLSPDAGSVSSSSAMTIKRLINEYGALGTARSEPMSQSIPFTSVFSLVSPKPDIGMLPPNLQPLPNAVMQPDLPMEPLSPDPGSVSPSLAMTIKRMINEYGAPISESMSKSIPLTPVFSLHSPKPDMGVLPPNLQPFPNAVMQPDLPMEPLSPNADSVSSSSFMTIKRMINGYGAPVSASEPKNELMSPTPVASLSSPRPDFGVFSMTNLHPMLGTIPRFSNMAAPLMKDANYYKTLVKQHGEKHETQFGKPHSHVQEHKQAQHFKPIKTNEKNQKPCMYFNSSKGCRNGSKCWYEHVMPNKSRPGSVLEAPIAKKMKLGKEISGNT
ncbi:zinc finger CCCH domain-containing protein 6-like isoform X2 [Cornus florida]|uniref:zinc finger CCCH domain-containing protein 6-like isoform X2 n=1 Tax=Cornus florida TaxID=4283 RepID=UPI0028A11AB7|nr:zinc finger CCCH domain-containing protein 6-like isoform X2 [Cornus florida]